MSTDAPDTLSVQNLKSEQDGQCFGKICGCLARGRFVLYTGKHPFRTKKERKGEQDIAIVL